jgi:uncharacterized protein
MNCDSCALCCKLLAIPEIEKPAGQWCKHCTKTRGCDVYETRPEPCRG